METKSKDLSDKELESGAFDVPLDWLFTTYFQEIESFLRFKGVPDRDSYDACMEVFLVVMKNQGYHPKEDRPGRTPRGWLRHIAKRVASNWHGMQKRHRTDLVEPASFDDTLDEERLSDSQRLMRQQFLERWGEAVKHIDGEVIDAFILVELDDVSLPDAAQILGLSRSTVIDRVSDARAALEPIFARLRQDQPGLRLVKPKKG